MTIVFVDASLAATLAPDDVASLRAAVAAYGAPVFIVELGALAPSETMRDVVEPSNGAAYGARDAERLWEIIETSLQRARSFCAIGVTAPEAFFDSHALEVRLRRQMIDGCVLEQVAVLDCDGMRMEQRIEPRR